MVYRLSRPIRQMRIRRLAQRCTARWYRGIHLAQEIGRFLGPVSPDCSETVSDADSLIVLLCIQLLLPSPDDAVHDSTGLLPDPQAVSEEFGALLAKRQPASHHSPGRLASLVDNQLAADIVLLSLAPTARVVDVLQPGMGRAMHDQNRWQNLT